MLLRLSLAAVFAIGGFFAGYGKIVTFGMPAVSLAAIGIGLAAGIGVRFFAAAACAVLLWFLAAKIGAAPAVIGYFNSVKREFALLAAAGVLTAVGGGRLFVIGHAHKGLASWCDVYFSRKRAPGTLTGPAGLSRRAEQGRDRRASRLRSEWGRFQQRPGAAEDLGAGPRSWRTQGK